MEDWLCKVLKDLDDWQNLSFLSEIDSTNTELKGWRRTTLQEYGSIVRLKLPEEDEGAGARPTGLGI